jgi:hypothetical protein
MPLHAECPNCRAVCAVPDNAICRAVRCRHCLQLFRVNPSADHPAAASAAGAEQPAPKEEHVAAKPLGRPARPQQDNPPDRRPDRPGRHHQRQSGVGLVLGLLGSGVLLMSCLCCFGVGLGSLGFAPRAQDPPPVFVPAPLAGPAPAVELPPDPGPGEVGPPGIVRLDQPFAFPPALPSPRADERIRNGDFEQGLKGFRSAYRHSPGNIRDEFTFAIVRSPREVHDSAAAFGDHTSGTGLMMTVNGADAADRLLWGQTLAVCPGAEYTFSLWLASWFSMAPAELQIQINGKVLGRVVASPQCGEWKHFQAKWNAGAVKEASIEIVNLTRAISGNDFAIDDISLRGPPPAAGPAKK